MPEDDEEERTLVTCPKCGESIAPDCSLCGGAGSVSAAVSAAWRFERAGRMARGSGEFRVVLPPKGKP